jgi:hypothetical protein
MEKREPRAVRPFPGLTITGPARRRDDLHTPKVTVEQVPNGAWRITGGICDVESFREIDQIAKALRAGRKNRKSIPAASRAAAERRHELALDRHADLERRIAEYRARNPGHSAATMVANLNLQLIADGEKATSVRTVGRLSQKTRHHRR